MKPWDIWTWNFPGAGAHPAVILGEDARVKFKPKVNVILCSSQRATREPEVNEVMLDAEDGLDWETLCKCDLLYSAAKSELVQHRGSVSHERRRAIARRVIQCLGFAGL